MRALNLYLLVFVSSSTAEVGSSPKRAKGLRRGGLSAATVMISLYANTRRGRKDVCNISAVNTHLNVIAGTMSVRKRLLGHGQRGWPNPAQHLDATITNNETAKNEITNKARYWKQYGKPSLMERCANIIKDKAWVAPHWNILLDNESRPNLGFRSVLTVQRFCLNFFHRERFLTRTFMSCIFAS